MGLDVWFYLVRKHETYCQIRTVDIEPTEKLAMERAKFYVQSCADGSTAEVIAFGTARTYIDSRLTSCVYPQTGVKPVVCKTIAKFRNVNGKVEEVKND